MEERGLRRCAGQSGHRRFIGADMVSWIEIKNECSDHVNYKLGIKEDFMDIKDFTVMLDEYIVIDKKDGFLYYWSVSMAACFLFLRVNKSLDATILHI